jgi:drug/metabolite transporter (DMT)-like permease
MATPATNRYRLGALCGLASATLFGISAPIAKLLLPTTSPWLLAGLLYLGAGLGLSLVRAVTRGRDGGEQTGQLRRDDLSRLIIICLTGGVAGPILLLVGLRRVSGVVGSLLLNLEAVFTMLLAVVAYRERLSRWEAAGGLVVIVGAVIATYQPGQWSGDVLGAAAIAGACLSWAVDNNVTRQISVRDPVQIVQVKTLAAGMGNALLAVLVGHRVDVAVLPAAVLLGFVSYGLSIVLDVYALRYLGAAREAAFFATAPFVGAIAAVPLLHEPLRFNDLMAAAFMAIGIALVLRGWR